MAFVQRVRVRYNECDAQGAVFNSNYLVYFDVTLTEMWREAFGAYQVMERDGIDLVVAEANVRYYLPARFDDELDIEAKIESLGTTSFTTRFTVRRGEDTTTEGLMRHVVVALDGTGKRPIPDAIRTKLETYA